MPADDILRMRISSLFQKCISTIKNIIYWNKFFLWVKTASLIIFIAFACSFSCYFNIRPAKRILDPRKIIIKLNHVRVYFLFHSIKTEIQCRQLTGFRTGFIHWKRFLNHFVTENRVSPNEIQSWLRVYGAVSTRTYALFHNWLLIEDILLRVSGDDKICIQTIRGRY